LLKIWEIEVFKKILQEPDKVNFILEFISGGFGVGGIDYIWDFSVLAGRGIQGWRGSRDNC